jgi:methyltransferase-like protein 23
MSADATASESLTTAIGDLPLHEYRYRSGGREWSLLHAAGVVNLEDEMNYLQEIRDQLPYGVALWPSAVALANEVVTRADQIRGTQLLELGAGTGLPGIVAASLGARVVQSDGDEAVLSLCRRNGEGNGAAGVEYLAESWDGWRDRRRYDWIVGSDILYVEAMHPHLRRIFEQNLAPGGRIMLADPFREASFRFFMELESDGWLVVETVRHVGDGGRERPVGIFDLSPPGGAG